MTRRNDSIRRDMVISGLAVPFFLVVAVLIHNRVLMIPAAMCAAGFAVLAACDRVIRRRLAAERDAGDGERRG